MLYAHTQPKTRQLPSSDGSIIREYVPLWSLLQSNHFLRLIHEIVHFTHASDEAVDDYGRALYVTLHRFVLMETDRTLPQDVAECPQFSLYRSRAPSQTEWPRAVIAHRYRLINTASAQIFTRHYVCDDEEFDLEMRREIPNRRS